MLQIPQLSKSYGETKIIDIKNFELDNGLYWFKGANGAGKSTFFKAISGLISFKGDCTIKNISLKKSPIAYRKEITYCEAEPEFPDFLTQKDLVHFVAKARNTQQKQIDHLQMALGTKSYENQPVGTYSSGMLKKTGLLLAFLGKPSIILLDEPFTAIDHQSVGNLIELIKEYQTTHKVTFLVTSHIDSGHYHLPFDNVYKIEDKKIQEVV
ncbi:MAG: ABC transporter ATP-binding protein [Cyclobacteriaceae bacterium]|nr:ABC transporter ATP-binding protein [Cyclobacteriaceae bacterium]